MKLFYTLIFSVILNMGYSQSSVNQYFEKIRNNEAADKYMIVGLPILLKE